VLFLWLSSSDGYTDLEPFVSKSTLEFHHDKHHAKYVAVTNEMIKGTDLEGAPLEDIVKKAKGKLTDTWSFVSVLFFPGGRREERDSDPWFLLAAW